ncbi:MAG: hypothetical protein QW728_05045 [Thermoplasmata archaeon]
MTGIMNYFIAKIPLAHCKRGPERCRICKDYEESKFCLIEVFPDSDGQIQRRTITINTNPVNSNGDAKGEKQIVEFEVIMVFNTAEEAELYSKENKIEFI